MLMVYPTDPTCTPVDTPDRRIQQIGPALLSVRTGDPTSKGTTSRRASIIHIAFRIQIS